MSAEGARRKLKALLAVIDDKAATEEERATARRLVARFKAKLTQEGVPQGDWSDRVFRFGRALRRVKETTAPPPSLETGSAKAAFRLGRALRQAAKKINEP